MDICAVVVRKTTMTTNVNIAMTWTTQPLNSIYSDSTHHLPNRSHSKRYHGSHVGYLTYPLHPTTTSDVSLKESHMEGIEEVGSILSCDDDDDETRSVYSYDNHDTISGSRFRTCLSGSIDRDIIVTQQQTIETEERYPVGHGLSSQAEAYYALGAVYRHILAESTPNMSNSEMTRRRSDSLDDIDRLDYEITQMDIVRMNRIASRHLDVESIVRLPVLTYQQKNASSKKRSQLHNTNHTRRS